MSEQNLTPDNAEDTEGHYLRPMSQPTDPKKDSYRVAFEKFVESQREGVSETGDDTEGHRVMASDSADDGDDTEGHSYHS